MAPRFRWLLPLLLGLLGCRSGGNARPPAEVDKPSDQAAACGRPSCPEAIYRRETSDLMRGIEVDDTDVYWCEATVQGLKVQAAPKNGKGSVRTLGDWYDFEAGRSLVVDARHVYWLAAGGGLQRAPKQGGATESLPLPAAYQKGVGPLEDWGDAVLVGGHDCRFAVRVPKDGSAATGWAISGRRIGGVTGFAVDGGTITCASGSTIFELDTQAGKLRELVSDQSMAGPLVRAGSDLYFVNNRPSTGDGENLGHLPAGAAAAIDLGPLFGHVGRLHHDPIRRTIHWATGLSPVVSHIGVYHLDDKRSELLFDKVDVMGTSAADATYLYWLANHAVMRLKK
jgi:hypothetical protein